MENAKIEMLVVAERLAEQSAPAYRELMESELALVGGGMGETVL